MSNHSFIHPMNKFLPDTIHGTIEENFLSSQKESRLVRQVDGRVDGVPGMSRTNGTEIRRVENMTRRVDEIRLRYWDRPLISPIRCKSRRNSDMLSGPLNQQKKKKKKLRYGYMGLYLLISVLINP